MLCCPCWDIHNLVHITDAPKESMWEPQILHKEAVFCVDVHGQRSFRVQGLGRAHSQGFWILSFAGLGPPNIL